MEQTRFFMHATMKAQEGVYERLMFVEGTTRSGNECFGDVDDGFWFTACSPEFKTTHATHWMNNGKIVRIWHFDPSWSTPPTPPENKTFPDYGSNPSFPEKFFLCTHTFPPLIFPSKRNM